MSEYLEVQDETGRVRSLKVDNPVHADGYIYFDSEDENGEIQHYRVKFNKE